MLRGIIRYARLHGPWSFYITPSDFEQALPKMKLWGGSGIIARVETLETAEAIVAAGIPAVLVGADQRVAAEVPQLAGMSEVWADSEGAARMAAEHLLERGFEYFAYVGLPERIWSQRREEAFCTVIRQSGFEPIYGRHGQRRTVNGYASNCFSPIGSRSCPSPPGSWPATTTPAGEC